MQNIQSILKEIIHSLYPNTDFSPKISPAPKPELGEYCINVFPLAKPLGKAPNIIAEEISTQLAKRSDIFTSTNATGGYVNFFLADSIWTKMFQELPSLEPHNKNGKKAIMEIFSLNVGKPLHIGHLCPTSTGQAIVNVHRFLGWDIIVDNHMGDWGSLFGKLIVGYQKYGSKEKLHRDGVEHLQELYIKITADIEKDPNVDEECKEAFRKLSKGDQQLMELWGEFTLTSLEKANAVIAKLHAYNDVAIGEAFYEGLPLPKIGEHPDLRYNMDSIVAELIEKGIATKNEDGSVGIIFDEETKLPSTILEKRDGTHGYLASDLACVKYRITNGWNPDKISIGTDIRQALHFKQVFTTARLAGWIPQNMEIVHVGNGFISLPDGAMSSRKGNIIRLEDLIEEGIQRTRKILEGKGRHLSDRDIQEIAVGAIKYSYLMQDRERNIIFDWDKALNFEGNSGPYIQYAFVRASKIVKESGFVIATLNLFQGKQSSVSDTSGSPQSYSLLRDDGESSFALSAHDKSLIQKLAEFEGKVETTAKTYKPHHIALYAYDLAVAFNSFYVHTPKILEEPNTELKNFRLSLVAKTTETLKTAFQLLAIEMPNEM